MFDKSYLDTPSAMFIFILIISLSYSCRRPIFVYNIDVINSDLEPINIGTVRSVCNFNTSDTTYVGSPHQEILQFSEYVNWVSYKSIQNSDRAPGCRCILLETA